ncbi:MAG TPA: hypothetical protein VGV18_12190, partial [Verrucomicrobiae bacterium]|nr:hypothetical protein [Verrucomicrobiae bacterium]
MKDRISNLFGLAALALVFLAPPDSWARSIPAPDAPAASTSAVAPPTLLAGMDPNSPFGRVVRMLQTGASESAILADIAG